MKVLTGVERVAETSGQTRKSTSNSSVNTRSVTYLLYSFDDEMCREDNVKIQIWQVFCLGLDFITRKFIADW